MERQISHNAATFIEVARAKCGVNLAYNEQSVAWVDGYIERNRRHLDERTLDALIDFIGPFLGECIRRRYGGRWEQVDGRWAIRLDDKNVVFPVAEVEKQLRHGSGASILSLYTALPILCAGGEGAPGDQGGAHDLAAPRGTGARQAAVGIPW
jgi:hypothetical protein